MAVSSSSTFSSGKNQGVPTVSADFDKFAKHATPRFAIGFKVEDGDGNVYRYSHFGADTNRGVLVSQDVSESSLGDSDNVIVASASCANTSDGTKGSRYLNITTGNYSSGGTATEVTANQFAGGTFITSDDAGEGYTYDIVGNTTNAGSSTIRVELRQPIQVALGATTDFIIVGNKYANLEIATNGTDCTLAGVTCQTMDVSEEAWGWVQTKGLVGILCAGTDVLGEKVVLSQGTSGAVICASSVTESSQSLDQVVGSCVVAGDSTGHGVYYINLE
jgi:hypothetical protein